MQPWPRPRSWSLAIQVSGLLVAAAALAAAGTPADQPALPTRRAPRAIIVVVGRARWLDLRRAQAPHLHWLMAHGAVGLMPVAAPPGRHPSRTYVTLGAGRAAAGTDMVGLAEPADGRLRQADLAELLAANRHAHTGARPGWLGDSLRAADNVYLLGPASGPLRGIAVVMDSAGLVAGGERVGPPVGAVGWQTAPWAARLEQALHRYPVVLVDLGDFPDALEAGAQVATLKAAIAHLDGLLDRALAAAKEHKACLWLLSCSSPRSKDPEFHALGPVMTYRTGGDQEAGLLSSPSTRWPGVIAPSDFAPSLLASMGLPASDSGAQPAGRPVRVAPDAHRLEALDRLDRLLTARYQVRVLAAQCYVAYGLVVVLGVLWLALARRPSRAFAAAALGLGFVPVGLLIGAAAPPEATSVYLALAAVVALGLGLLGVAWRDQTRGLAIAMLAGTAVIAADLALGSRLMRGSALEMGVMLGSRYYGIGNEYMGALVGLATIGLGSLLQVAPRAGWVAACGGALLSLAVGTPLLGANWGGCVTVASGFLALWLLLQPRRGVGQIALAVLALAAAAVAPGALDLLVPPEARSHIGPSFAAALQGDGASLAETIHRKLAIAWSLLRAAPWSLAAAGLAGLAFWGLLRPDGRARRALRGLPAVNAGIASALIAAAMAMAVNDSGPAAALGAVLAALAAVVSLAAREESRP